MSENNPEQPGLRATFHIPFYDGILKQCEIWLLMIALLVVIGASALNILFRNLEWAVWNPTIVNQVVYALTFYLGIFGGVIAARRAQHIGVDAVSHYMPKTLRRWMGVLLQLCGATACVTLMILAYEWVDAIEHDEFLVPRMPIAWLSKRLWLWPMVGAFGLMSLHFVINSLRFGVAAMRPETATSNADKDIDHG